MECDDPGLRGEFHAMFGSRAPAGAHAPPDIHVEIRSSTHPSHGWFHVAGADTLPVDAREFEFAVELEGGRFARVVDPEPGWSCVSWRGTPETAFAFRGREC